MAKLSNKKQKNFAFTKKKKFGRIDSRIMDKLTTTLSNFQRTEEIVLHDDVVVDVVVAVVVIMTCTFNFRKSIIVYSCYNTFPFVVKTVPMLKNHIIMNDII